MPTITGKINTPVKMQVQKAGDWEQLSGPRVNLRIETDGTSASFTPSENGVYEFKCSSVADKFTVQVGQITEPEQPPVEPPVEPEPPVVTPPVEPSTGTDEELIYDSDNFWGGEARTITDIEGDDKIPNSGYARMNASGKPKLHVLGDAGQKHAILETVPKDDGSDSFGRWYLGKCNYNMKMRRKVRFVTDSAITDSSKPNARHQFRDVVDSKAKDVRVQGGLGFHIKRDKAGVKVEVVHGGATAGDKEVSLPFKIKTGEYYDSIYTVWHDEAKKVIYEKIEIEYPIGSGHKEILNYKVTDAPDQFFNKVEFEEWSEIWVGRLNGKGGKIEYARVRVWKLNKKPEGLAT